MTISGVWYRREPNSTNTLKDILNWDTGILSIDNGRLEFDGKRHRIIISKILAVTFGLAGRDPVTAWIDVLYEENGEKEHAYFADGKLIGYSGFFGGTRRILSAIRPVVPNPNDVVINNSYLINHIVILICTTLVILAIVRRFLL